MGYILQNFNQKRRFLCNVTHTCIKFFTKTIQIIQKNIAYFHNQGKYEVFGKKVLKGGNKNAFKDFTKRKMSLP